MSSIIEGYNYDIFISYRQKDNKHDGWVTEFVNNLKGELESTFKEEVGVYFDINPHDGLLETHDVDASLKEKLKCLIFIPIISRTYCDPNSFAWEHEFKAFVEMASKDQYGLKVKLPNGNVASRVLPVRIHELDPEDKKQCELVLGSILRGVEFIYREPGVNKPLTVDDEEETNLNKTKYRLQINKVANSIREIISGLQRRTEDTDLAHAYEESGTVNYDSTHNHNRNKWLKAGLSLIILLAAILFGVSVIIRHKPSNPDKLSVAVIPFRNLTNNIAWNIWQDGIQVKLTMHLSDYPDDLFVNQPESVSMIYQGANKVNYASLTPASAREISTKLGADIFIYGSILQTGSVLYLNAQAIETSSKKILKSFETHTISTEDSIFRAIEPLCKQISDYLLLSKIGQEATSSYKTFKSWNIYTNSPEAYRYYLMGIDAFLNSDYETARPLLLKSLESDSSFSIVKSQLAFAYGNPGNYSEAKKWAAELQKDKERMSPFQKATADFTYSHFFQTPNEELLHLKKIIRMDDQNAIFHWQTGDAYLNLHQYENTIIEMGKALDIFEEWGVKPMWDYCYTNIGYAYHKLGQYKKEGRIYSKAEKDFPESRYLAFRQAVLAQSKGDSARANDYLERHFTLIEKNTRLNESEKYLIIANMYNDAELPDKAEYYYRKAFLTAPDNIKHRSSLGYFLIDKDRNIEEGMRFVNTLLKFSPDNYGYLHSYGWGLYKQGRFGEATEYLQKSWDLRMQNGMYNHTAFLHLEAARKAMGQDAGK